MAPFLVLDGGMGRQLKKMGAPFKQPEWSALALIEAPSFVLKAHEQYIDAGVDVITTNAYAVVPFHIGDARFKNQGASLAALAGTLARQAADGAGRKVLVAGCLPPPCGSYAPTSFDPAVAARVLGVLVTAQAPSVDFWLAETLSTCSEAAAARAALDAAADGGVTGASGKPLWLSFSLRTGGGHASNGAPLVKLPSGESVAEAVAAARRAGASALLFNCCAPELMRAALAAASAALAADRSPPPHAGGVHLRLGAYANAFESEPAAAKANQSLHTLRPGLTPGLYADFARDWVAAGARVIGGCCGVGPEHIEAVAALRASLAAGDNKLQVLHAGAKLGGAGVVAAASVQLEE